MDTLPFCVRVLLPFNFRCLTQASVMYIYITDWEFEAGRIIKSCDHNTRQVAKLLPLRLLLAIPPSMSTLGYEISSRFLKGQNLTPKFATLLLKHTGKTNIGRYKAYQ